MTEAFLKIVNMSISAGWLVLAVLALRLVLKKAPKWVNVLLWGIVAVRLVCPFSIESALSLIPSAQTLPQEVISGPHFTLQSGIGPVDRQVNDYLSDHYWEGVTVPANHGANVMGVLTVVWLVGMAVLTAYTVISYLRLRRDLRMAVILRENIYQCETVQSPFVLGFLRPRIYLPYGMEVKDLRHVVAHEQAHIARKDHWWKPLGFALLTVYWFNPLMWLAYILLCRDIELACDERVIRELGSEQRADYSEALVACAVSRRAIAACPLAFGEVGVKDRVRSIMNYRRPAFWIIVLAVLLCVILAVSMLTDPIRGNTPARILAALEPGDVQWAQITVWDQPAGDHIALDRAQIDELVSILNALGEKDLAEKTGMHGISVMVYCGELEILMHIADEHVYFSFDSETAEAYGNVSWSIRSRELTAFIDNIVYSKPDSTFLPMEPTQTNLRGLVAGYLFVPINGATYRYGLTEPDPVGVTADKLLDTCTEETPMEGIVWEVYSLKEYPDMTKLLIISGTNSAWLCEYAPARQAEEGALQAVREAGYVVEENGRLTSGADALEAFYQATRAGTPGFLQVAHYYTLDPDRTAPDTYEAYRQDYPALHIHELSYDGEVFVLRTEEDVRVYEYLMKYAGDETRYVLTHDNTHTWDQIRNSLFSSVMGVAIEHHSIGALNH